MNYPQWEVPGIGSAWVIGLISIFHVLIAWFAVGGGLYLPLAEAKAMREGRPEWIPIIKQHSRFFLVLTSIFGALSGVGIWFAIGLVNPEATSALIHNFVFGWAIEWDFFVMELAAAAAYYLTWDRIPPKLHLKIGYAYAIFSFLTLVIINGILSFMLTPGAAWLSSAGTGNESAYFWHAFFNPTYFPSLVIRTLACASLAGVWALVTLSRLPDTNKAKVSMTRWSAQWLIPMFILLPISMLWFLAMVPAAQHDLLALGMYTIGSGMFTQVTRISMLGIITTATIVGVVYLFAYRHPRDFSFGHAMCVLFLAVIATASTEYSRETIRKPYVVGSYMYANGVRVAEVDKFNRDGYFTQSVWSPTEEMALGKQMFRGQCMSCHTESGYRSLRKLLQGRNQEGVANLLKELHKTKDGAYQKFMPPLVGSETEIAALGKYLHTLTGTPEKDTKVAVR